MKYNQTKEMLANILTKPLQGLTFRKLRGIILGQKEEQEKVTDQGGAFRNEETEKCDDRSQRQLNIRNTLMCKNLNYFNQQIHRLDDKVSGTSRDLTCWHNKVSHCPVRQVVPYS